MTVEQLVMLLGSLGGFSTLIAFIVNLLKSTGVIKDGSAGNVSTGLDLLALVILYLTGIYAPGANLGVFSQIAASIAQLGILVLPLFGIGMATTSFLGHKAIRGFPILGKSYSYGWEHAQMKAPPALK